MSGKSPAGREAWRKRIFATLWVTYASFYLCRVNLAVAVPKIMEATGFTRSAMGVLGSVFFIVYAAGQFINGQIGDRWNARFLIFTGIVCSAYANILFGLSSAFILMAVLWGCNGYFQSMGWAPCVKVLSNWFPGSRKGVISGVFASSYYLGNVISWFLAGWVLLCFSWKAAFIVPALLFIASGIQFLLLEKDDPVSAGFQPVPASAPGRHSGGMQSLQFLRDPGVWLAGFATMCLSSMSSGFIYWIPTYLYEKAGLSIAGAAFRALLFPLAGCAGAMFAGWASDRMAGSKRSPVIIPMLLLSGILTLLMPGVPGTGVFALAVIALTGFMINGPQMLLTVTLAMDLGGREKAASSAGFMDAMSYAGAGAGAFISGYLIDRSGWHSAFQFWAAGIAAAVFLTLFIWRNENDRKRAG